MDIIFHPSDKGIKKRRIWELDFLRGVCILAMVFDHFMLDLWFLEYWVVNFYSYSGTLAYRLSDFALGYWFNILRISIRIFVLFIFLFISGISCSLSRNNNIRLLKLTLASVVLNVVTILLDLFFDMGVSIYFGILHIIALSLLIYILLFKLSKNKYLPLIVGIIFVVIGVIIDFNNIPSLNSISRAPTFNDFLKMIVGLVNIGSDSYGIVPYTGVFLIGAFYGRTIYTSRSSLLPILDKPWHTPISFIGRNTIWVYLLHQPLVFALAILIAKMSGMSLF